ncbi:sensor histidine kinase [Adhaeribacter aquaticus]|uniref:sensor histidine kinase n=1 Tax=Adhaeribacter aquaticus TaxID=299567 RepID=UPI001FE192D9|nr:ATP-binding protein [Adhaeribacter aquaticus]
MHQEINNVTGNNVVNIFQGGGEMGALMRDYNWDNHPLGNPANWPGSLKNNIRLLLNSGFPMFLWWSEELFMFHNDAYLPALGNKHPEALGARAREMWSEIWKEVGVVVENILQGGKPFYAEALPLYLERKGFLEETYWTFSYSPAFENNGLVNGIFCACDEVTGMVQGARRLKSLKDVSEGVTTVQTLEQVGQLTCDLLYQNNNDLPFCLIYLLNNTATTATLMGKAGPISEKAAPLAIDMTDAEVPWMLHQVEATRQAVVLDCSSLKISSGQGQVLPDVVQQATVLPIMRPGQNKIIGFFISGISPLLEYKDDYRGYHSLIVGQIANSISSVQAREALTRQQQYLKEIFEQAPVGIAIVRGPEHIIDLANPTVCEIWRRKPEEVMGKPVKEALPEVVDQGIIQLLDTVVNTGVPFKASELPLNFERNGVFEKSYLNFIYHPMRDTQGFITGVIAVAIDITEQVKFRQSVEALNEELLATNADLDNFVYSASHDLKTPILNIEGLMTALIEEMPSEALHNEGIRHIIQLIEGAINRFRKTVLDLSEVAKIQRQDEADLTYVNLAAVVAEVRLDLEAQIQEANAQIQTALVPDITIQFSAKNIRSIIYNLLSNALKYRSPDRQPVIQISSEITPTHVILSVTDNGLGFKVADEDKIFSMFKRLHDHVEGTGIGLYIVKRIVQNAGGYIKVESQVGVGSTFNIFFKK